MSGNPPRNDSANAPTQKRTFRSPSGRDWTVEAFDLAAGSPVRSASGEKTTRMVLRFQSSEITLDLRSLPAHWESLTDDELVNLLRSANPPSFGPF